MSSSGIERDLEDMTPDERYEARLKRSLPVLDAFLAWLNDRSLKAPAQECLW